MVKCAKALLLNAGKGDGDEKDAETVALTPIKARWTPELPRLGRVRSHFGGAVSGWLRKLSAPFRRL